MNRKKQFSSKETTEELINPINDALQELRKIPALDVFMNDQSVQNDIAQRIEGGSSIENDINICYFTQKNPFSMPDRVDNAISRLCKTTTKQLWEDLENYGQENWFTVADSYITFYISK
jgi:hypothetical protein